MDEHGYSWQESYRRAVAEFNSVKQRTLISIAFRTMESRRRQLRGYRNPDECLALRDALVALQRLKITVFSSAAKRAKPIRLVVCEQSDSLRYAICSLLARRDIELVAEAASYSDLVRLLREESPNVALVDLCMWDQNRVAADQLKSELREVAILAMSIRDDAGTMELAQKLGARGLLKKAHLASLLVPAIRNCVRKRHKTSSVANRIAAN